MDFPSGSDVLLIEPFYSGSHRQLIDLLHAELQNNKISAQLITMTGKKWHWRARTSGLYFFHAIPTGINYRTIFASSVLPLHDLIALRPDLSRAKKILYFHENQLIYPKQNIKKRDFQYGYNQILSCLVADEILFNSKFNMDSFLCNLDKFFKLQPDYRPKHLRDIIEPKSRVLYYPLQFNQIQRSQAKTNPTVHRILWPHRWEFDKNPDLFFKTLYKLVEVDGIENFRLSILGENFTENSEIFEEAKVKLSKFIDHFGFLPEKADYYRILQDSDIVISTAYHEFFGVAIMEAVYAGCYPLCPDRLVYPELLNSQQFLYKSDDDLYVKLKILLTSEDSEIKNLQNYDFNFCRFDWNFLKGNYMELFRKE